MEGNSALDELLVAFILKELDAGQEAKVLEHINASPEIKRYFEALQQTWQLTAAREAFDKVDIDDEWQHFEQAIARKTQPLAPVKKMQPLIATKPGLHPQQPTAYWKKGLLSVAVAAALILAVVGLWTFLQEVTRQTPTLAKTTPTNTTPVAVRRHEVNRTGRIRKLSLPDGTLVSLFNNSEIIYKEPFAINRRDITLKGKASFRVAKDSTRPFTVFSEDLATTAIGTHFLVTAFPELDVFRVRLYEGKVVVRSANLLRRTLRYDYYLLPGQELVYNHLDSIARLVNFNVPAMPARSQAKAADSLVPDDPSLPDDNTGSWYMFNNQNIGDIFDQLEVMFNTEISYSKKDVRNFYFIGKFDKTDSLYTILDQIASLNNLRVTRNQSKYVIGPRKAK